MEAETLRRKVRRAWKAVDTRSLIRRDKEGVGRESKALEELRKLGLDAHALEATN